MSEAPAEAERQPFRLSDGGLFRSLEHRTGLVHGDDYRMKRRVLLGIGLTWLPLAVLSAFGGVLLGDKVVMAFLRDPAPYARFLLALPLLFAAERIIDGMIRAVTGSIEKAKLVAADDRPRYHALLDALARRRDWIGVDVTLLLLAFGLTLWLAAGQVAEDVQSGRATWIRETAGTSTTWTLAGQWYRFVSVPFFQFLGFRWLWRFLLWGWFLFRLSRLGLALEPGHPDRAGGLGIVGNAQRVFAILLLAGSVVLSGVLAREILYGGTTLAKEKMIIFTYVIGCVVVLVLPLLSFLGPLLNAKRRGLMQYGVLGVRLSRAFRRKWTDGQEATGDALLDSPAPSAVADYAADFEAVSKVRLLPISIRSLIPVTLLLFLPFIPLVFTERTILDLIRRLSGMLF